MIDQNLSSTFVKPSAHLKQPPDLRPALKEDVQADVVIIGGGYLGLHTAITLRDEGVDVVLLEQEFCGYGASGRNGGNLVGPGMKELRKQMASNDDEERKRYFAYIDRNVNRAKEMINRFQIDCDLNLTGTIYMTPHPDLEREGRDLVEQTRRYGYTKVDFWDRNKLRERQLPLVFRSGVFVDGGGTLNPGKLVLGLRQAAIDMGVRVYEKSFVSNIEDGPTVTVRTHGGGTARAPKIVIATGGFTPSTLKRFGDKVAAFHLPAFETEPMTPEQRESIGWPHREGIATMHYLLESYRISVTNTLLSDTKRVMIPFRNRILTEYQPSLIEPLVAAFREKFPTLCNLRIVRTWQGWCGLTTDRLPLVGITGSHSNIYYCVGFNGHGIAPTSGMGQSMGLALIGKPDSHFEFMNRNPMGWPPEPFRWLGAKAYLSWLARKDAKIDMYMREQQAG